MLPRKRISTRNLHRGGSVDLPATSTHAPASLSPLDLQKAAQLVPDLQASIASIGEAFPASFSARIHEMQGIFVPSSTASRSSLSVSSPTKTSNKKKKKGKGKAKRVSVLGQSSGNRAGNPILISDDEGENPSITKSAEEAATGAASSTRESSQNVNSGSDTHMKDVAVAGSARRPSGPMSPDQLIYLQSKYDNEARNLESVKGGQTVRESEGKDVEITSVTAAPKSVATPGPILFDPPAFPKMAEEKKKTGVLKKNSTLPIHSLEMNEERLDGLKLPDTNADLVARVTFLYTSEGVLEADPLEISDFSSLHTSLGIINSNSTREDVEAATSLQDLASPSFGLVDWVSEFNKILGLPADYEHPEGDYTESEYERMMTGGESKEVENPAENAKQETMAIDGPLQYQGRSTSQVQEKPNHQQAPELDLLPKKLPYLALDAELYDYGPTDITKWLHDVSLESQASPEILTLEQLDAEMDDYWKDILEITSQPEVFYSQAKPIKPLVTDKHQAVPLSNLQPQVELSVTTPKQCQASDSFIQQPTSGYSGDFAQILSYNAEKDVPRERRRDLEGDIELPDQITTSPLTLLSVISTPTRFEGEDISALAEDTSENQAVEWDTNFERRQKKNTARGTVSPIPDDGRTPLMNQAEPLTEESKPDLGSIVLSPEIMVEVAIPTTTITGPISAQSAATAPSTPQPDSHRRRAKRASQISPQSFTRHLTRSRASLRREAETFSTTSTSTIRRRSARISGAGVPERSPRHSSPAMSVASEGRRSSRTNTSYIHRYHDTRQSQGSGEGEEAEDDEVDMI